MLAVGCLLIYFGVNKMWFGLALIIIPPIVGGLLLYSFIKIWQDEDEKLKQTEIEQAYKNLSDGTYVGKLDVRLGVTNGDESFMYNTFRFKICKGELYNIERMENKDGYFAVEVTKGFYIILSGDKVNKYFEKVRDEVLE